MMKPILVSLLCLCAYVIKAQNNHTGDTHINGGRLQINHSGGIGDHLLNINGPTGRNLGVLSYYPVQGQLRTRIGINNAINGGDGITEYAILGSKKAPFIELNAENGSVSIYGENGSGNNWRFSSASKNLGLLVDMHGRVGIGTASPGRTLHVKSTTSDRVAMFESASVWGTLLKLNSTGAGGRQYTLMSTANQAGQGPGRIIRHH